MADTCELELNTARDEEETDKIDSPRPHKLRKISTEKVDTQEENGKKLAILDAADFQMAARHLGNHEGSDETVETVNSPHSSLLHDRHYLDPPQDYSHPPALTHDEGRATHFQCEDKKSDQRCIQVQPNNETYTSLSPHQAATVSTRQSPLRSKTLRTYQDNTFNSMSIIQTPLRPKQPHKDQEKFDSSNNQSRAGSYCISWNHLTPPWYCPYLPYCASRHHVHGQFYACGQGGYSFPWHPPHYPSPWRRADTPYEFIPPVAQHCRDSPRKAQCQKERVADIRPKGLQ